MKRLSFTFLWGAFVLLTLSACGVKKSGEKLITENTADTSFFFGGYYAYKADAATFRDCATGVVMPVSVRGNYLASEQGYAQLDAQGNPVYAEFRGRVVTEPSQEEGRTQRALLIEQVIEYNALDECRDNSLVAGTYHSQATSNEKAPASTLRLNGDFTFTLTTEGAQGEVRYAGQWYRTYMDEGLLIFDDGQRYAFLINYETQVLMLYFPEFVNARGLNFKKV